MEQFMLDNAERYKRLVAAFTPTSSTKKGGESTTASSEIVVSARLRPMLDDETTQGFPQGVYLRGHSNTVDLHELRRPVRGPPTINVSIQLSSSGSAGTTGQN
jgi:kinesin family protein 2/24